MRKLISILFILTSLILACNDGGKKGQKDSPVAGDTSSNALVLDTCKLADVIIPEDLCRLQGSGNFIINPKVAIGYIEAFKRLYIDGNPTSGIQPHEWVSKCEVKALVDFFNSHDNYDGAWIVMTSDAQAADKTSINIVPSRPIVTGKENHEPDWNIVSTITAPGCQLSGHFSASSAMAADFRSVHRGETGTKPEGNTPLLSRRIWINACVFRSLYNIMLAFEGSATPMNGLFVYSAAYVPAPVKALQPVGFMEEGHSTVVLVLSYQCGDTYAQYPAWGVNNFLYEKLVKMAGVAPPPVYNHGELCPNACTTLD